VCSILVHENLAGRLGAAEIYYTASDGMISAVNIDTRQTRTVPHARGLSKADETLSVVKNGSAVDPDGTHPGPPVRPR
jgi:hypothetical protein